MNPVGYPEETDRSTLLTVLLSIAAAVLASIALQRSGNDAGGYIHQASGGLMPTKTLLIMLAFLAGTVLAGFVAVQETRLGTQMFVAWHWMLVAGTSIGLLTSLTRIDERTGLYRNVLTIGFLFGVVLAHVGAGALGMVTALWLFRSGSLNPWPGALKRGIAIAGASTLYAAMTHRRVVSWVLRRWLETSSGIVLRVLLNVALLVGSILAIGLSLLVLRRVQRTVAAPIFGRPEGLVSAGEHRATRNNYEALLLGAVALTQLMSFGLSGTVFSGVIRSASRNYSTPSSLGKTIQDQALLSALLGLVALALAFTVRNRTLDPGVVLGVGVGLSIVASETLRRGTSIDWPEAAVVGGTLSSFLSCSVFALITSYLSPRMQPVGFVLAIALPTTVYGIAQILVRLPSLERAPLLLGPIAILFIFLAHRLKPSQTKRRPSTDETLAPSTHQKAS
jgi:hypothetical protein